MSKVLHCTITRFVNPLDNENVRQETKAFLSASFSALQVEAVKIFDHGYSATDAAQRLSNRLFDESWLVDKSGDMLTQIHDRDLTMEISRGIKTFGANFKIKMAGELYGCSLFYHPGPLPLIELRTLFFPSSELPSEWAEKLLSTQAVHNLRTITHWLRQCSYYGFGYNRYLLWKRDLFFRGIEADEDAMHAGITLRALCRDVWQNHQKGLAKLEVSRFWRFSYSRSIRAFDKELVEEVGVAKLTSILKLMDVEFDQWKGQS